MITWSNVSEEGEPVVFIGRQNSGVVSWKIPLQPQGSVLKMVIAMVTINIESLSLSPPP